jgi:hypothetical protein
MKRFSKCVLLGLLGSMMLGVCNSRGDLEVSASVQIHAAPDFYAPLTPYGTWIEFGTYGRCWHPAGIAIDWRPYGYGHWEWTDCGWYWVSDEPWAWACYHYGSWVYEPAYGWLWVPGIEWAPAWVSWRFGGGYCGWAPLGPRGIVLAPSAFVFVEAGHFRDPVTPSRLIVKNTTIINKTTVIGGVRTETRTLGGAPQKVFVNHGPGVQVIQKATGKDVSAVPIREAVRKTPVPLEPVGRINEPRMNGKPAGAQAPANPPGAPKANRKDHAGPPPAGKRGGEDKKDFMGWPPSPKHGEAR